MSDLFALLGDVVDFKGGGTPSKDNPDFWADEVPWATVKDFKALNLSSTTDSISFLGLEKSSANLIKAGHVIIPTRMALGKALINDVDVAINQDLKALIPKVELDTKYLLHSMLGLAKTIEDLGSGATVKGVTLETLRKLKIPLPPLPEQKRIASILDAADTLRTKRRQAIAMLDELLQATFLDMFGDPVTNPKGWEVKKWEQVLDIVNGKNQKKVEVENGEYPIYGSGGEMGRANDWLVPENSVIIGRKGNINRPLLVYEKFWNVDTAFGLVPKKQQMTHDFLFWFCKFFNFERLNKTVTIPSLTKSDILRIKIPTPPLTLQTQFASIVEKVEAQKAVQQAHLAELDTLFASLQQRAFAGAL